LQRGLLDRMAGITGTGYQQAFEQAQNQFNTEQTRGMQAQNFANTYGLQALQQQLAGGGTERGIESEGIAADYAQFAEERDYPYKQVQYAQSLLQGLPISTQSYQYTQPTGIQSFAGGAGSVLDLLERFNLVG